MLVRCRLTKTFYTNFVSKEQSLGVLQTGSILTTDCGRQANCLTIKKGNLVTGRRERNIDVLDREILLIPEDCGIRYGLDSELTSKLRICSYTVVLPGQGLVNSRPSTCKEQVTGPYFKVFHPTRITHIRLTSVSENPRRNYGFWVRMFCSFPSNCITAQCIRANLILLIKKFLLYAIIF